MLQVTIAGRVTKDSELRFTAEGTPILGFSVAVDVGYGEKRHPVFVGCSLFGKRGESLNPYIKKGTPLTVTGEGDLRKWNTDTSSGSEITVKVSEVTLQGSRQGDAPAAKPDAGFRKPADKPATQADFADDDIPF